MGSHSTIPPSQTEMYRSTVALIGQHAKIQKEEDAKLNARREKVDHELKNHLANLYGDADKQQRAVL